MTGQTKFQVIEGDKPKRSIFHDLEALRVPPDDDDAGDDAPAEVAEHPSIQDALEAWERGTFIMVPMYWHDRMKELRDPGGDLFKLAWTLLYRANLEKRFPVTSRMMFHAGVARQYKRKILERLEQIGLVKVEWQPPPRVPWVTILHRVDRRRRRRRRRAEA